MSGSEGPLPAWLVLLPEPKPVLDRGLAALLVGALCAALWTMLILFWLWL